MVDVASSKFSGRAPTWFYGGFLVLVVVLLFIGGKYVVDYALIVDGWPDFVYEQLTWSNQGSELAYFRVQDDRSRGQVVLKGKNVPGLELCLVPREGGKAKSLAIFPSSVHPVILGWTSDDKWVVVCTEGKSHPGDDKSTFRSNGFRCGGMLWLGGDKRIFLVSTLDGGVRELSFHDVRIKCTPFCFKGGKIFFVGLVNDIPYEVPTTVTAESTDLNKRFEGYSAGRFVGPGETRRSVFIGPRLLASKKVVYRPGLRLGYWAVGEENVIRHLVDIPFVSGTSVELVDVLPSPESRFVALQLRFGKVSEVSLWVYDHSGTGRMIWTKVKSREQRLQATWTPDGLGLSAIGKGTEGWELFWMKSVLKPEPERFKGGLVLQGCYPVCSADGGELLLVGKDRIYRFDKRTLRAKSIVVRSRLGASSYIVSPKGKWLAYTLRGGEDNNIFVRSLKSGMTRSLLPITKKSASKKTLCYRLGQALLRAGYFYGSIF